MASSESVFKMAHPRTSYAYILCILNLSKTQFTELFLLYFIELNTAFVTYECRSFNRAPNLLRHYQESLATQDRD